MTDLPDLKLKVMPAYPASIIGGNGVDATKVNGHVVIDLAHDEFATQTAIPTSPTNTVLTYDTATGSYVNIPTSLLGGAVAGISDAPVDGFQYGRQSAGWTRVDMLKSVYDPTAKNADAFDAANESFIQTGAGAITRTSRAKMREIFSITDFGCVGDGTTDNAIPLQNAVNAAGAGGFILYVPAGIYFVGSTINFPVSSAVSMQGDGPGRSIFTTAINNPLFYWNVTSTIENCLFQDLGYINTVATGGAYTGSCVFYIDGNNTSFFQYCRFDDLNVFGFYSFFTVAKTPRTTIYGLESNVDWNFFERIRIDVHSNPSVVGWRYQAGSGTSTTYTNCKIVVSSAMIQVGGTGCVCGDILVDGCNIGGGGSAVVQINAGTVYNQRILVTGGQVDSGAAYLAALAPGGDYNNFSYVANNVGGGLDLYSSMPPIRNSVITHEDVGEWRVGNYKTTDATGALTLPMFNVDMGNDHSGSSGYNGCYAEMVVSGLVAGLASGVILKRYLLRLSGGTASVNVAETTGSPAPGSGFYDVATAISGSTVKFSVTLTPTANRTTVDAQLRVVGGCVRVQRL